MRRRRHFALLVLAAALACATPGAALAQNAGDEQYADPFGKVESKQKGSGGGQQGGSSQGNSAPSPQPAQSQPTVQSPSGSQPSATSSQTLPRTGLPAGVLGAMGLTLFGTGAALRRAATLPR